MTGDDEVLRERVEFLTDTIEALATMIRDISSTLHDACNEAQEAQERAYDVRGEQQEASHAMRAIVRHMEKRLDRLEAKLKA